MNNHYRCNYNSFDINVCRSSEKEYIYICVCMCARARARVRVRVYVYIFERERVYIYMSPRVCMVYVILRLEKTPLLASED